MEKTCCPIPTLPWAKQNKQKQILAFCPCQVIHIDACGVRERKQRTRTSYQPKMAPSLWRPYRELRLTYLSHKKTFFPSSLELGQRQFQGKSRLSLPYRSNKAIPTAQYQEWAPREQNDPRSQRSIMGGPVEDQRSHPYPAVTKVPAPAPAQQKNGFPPASISNKSVAL